jgi:hypothetical protein
MDIRHLHLHVIVRGDHAYWVLANESRRGTRHILGSGLLVDVAEPLEAPGQYLLREALAASLKRWQE